MVRHGITIALLLATASCGPMALPDHASPTTTSTPAYGPLTVAVRNSLPGKQPVLALQVMLGDRGIFSAQASGEGEGWEPALEPEATRVVWEERTAASRVEVSARMTVRTAPGEVVEKHSARAIEVPRHAASVLVELAPAEDGPTILIGRVPLAEIETGVSMCVEPEQEQEPSVPSC